MYHGGGSITKYGAHVGVEPLDFFHGFNLMPRLRILGSITPVSHSLCGVPRRAHAICSKRDCGLQTAWMCTVKTTQLTCAVWVDTREDGRGKTYRFCQKIESISLNDLLSTGRHLLVVS
jgi:hypothetical protein